MAIVTGGASGIGKATCLKFANNGCSVVLADINYSGAQEVILRCEAYGVDGIAIKTDISRVPDVKRVFSRTLRRFGRVDILINNAGIVETGSVEDTHEKTWDSMMLTNLKGPFLCCKEAISIMKGQTYGKIINISSISGKMGGIHSGPAYSASKAGLICFTKSLAKRLAPFSINVNSVAPGMVDTPMTKHYPSSMVEMIPFKRKARPEEIASLILFLVSDEASYITGETININGGLLMD